jgi:ubiquinol-cytochrome c reductase cytochrome b subunit
MGVVAIAITFASLIAMPFLSSTTIGSPKFRILSERLFFIFVADLALLTWVGAQEILDATIILGQICTVILFFYLVIAYPFLSWLESYLYLNSIKMIGNQNNN